MIPVDPTAFDYYVSTRPSAEQVIWRSRERDREVITAMQRRMARHPVRYFLWRRPWRAPSRPNLRSLGDTMRWLRVAHDCADPSIGCSCSGGFRFPNPSAGQ